MIDERFDNLILPTILEEDRIDLYHNPTFAVPLVRGRTRMVATVHDAVFKRHPELVEPRLRSYLDRATVRSAKCADHLITVSEFSKREIGALYGVPEERMTVIPNGVRWPEDRPSQPSIERVLASRGLVPEGFVLYVGSIQKKKNIDMLLRAFKELLQREPASRLRLALAGSQEGEDYSVESRIAELGIADRVVVLGYVSEDLLEALYRRALAFVYPSLYEGFGLPPLEAMARGVPTIVSDSSSLPEVVGEDALRVDPRDPQKLASAMLQLFHDSELRQELSKKGRQRAWALTWRKSASQHLDVFKAVAGKHHETHPSRV
jgi:glycosyltransferase involved in cell wall biosynthesis